MISHHRKCVFVHIPKNAGQSIEILFLKELGLTWETRAPLLLRHNDHPELGPPKLAHLKWHQYVGCNYLTQAQFDDYFTFSFVRNPWSRAVSMYKYLGYRKKCSFRDFLVNELAERLWEEKYWFVCPQNEFVCDSDGNVMVDFIGSVENLQADFNEVARQIGFPPTEVPHTHRSRVHRPHQVSKKSILPWRWRRNEGFPTFATFQEYYDDHGRDLVARLYRQDIDMFGYEFEQSAPTLRTA